MTLVKKALFLLTLALICLPSLQKEWELFPLKPLNGYFQTTPYPKFSDSAWFNNSYQVQFENNFNDSIGFRPGWIRIYNQLDFSLFSVPHAERVIVGKKGELFATGYIHGYLGLDYQGDRLIEERVKMLKSVQDILWAKKIFLVVLIPPDKGTFCPELIPDRYMKLKHHQLGRDYFVTKAAEMGVNVLDFNPWFKILKSTSKYPLFPTTGVHWTDYGAWLAADSATRYLADKTGFKMPRLVLKRLEITDQPRHNDDDINKTMNLTWDAPHASLAYPEYRVVSGSGQKKPSALFIGDSFFWGWYDQGIIDSLFANREFWYYDKEVFPECFTSPKYTREINLREAVERQNMVILFHVGAGGGNPGSGFIDRAYIEFDTTPTNKLREIIQTMKNSPGRLESLRKKALEKNVTPEEVMRDDAIGLFFNDINNKK